MSLKLRSTSPANRIFIGLFVLVFAVMANITFAQGQARPQRQPVSQSQFSSVLQGNGSHRVASGIKRVSHDSALLEQVTIAQVQSQLDSLDDHKELSEEQRTHLKQSLTQSIQWLQTEIESRKHAKAYQEQISQAPTKVKQLRHELSLPQSEPVVNLPPGAPLTQLESHITELEQLVEKNERYLAEVVAQIDGRTARIGVIAKEVADVENRLTEAESGGVADEENPYRTHVLQIERRARIQSLKAQADLLRVEEKRINALAEQWPLEHDVATRRLTISRQAVRVWKKTAEQWRRDESSRYATAARKLAKKSHPALRTLATRNAEIAELRVETAKSIEGSSSQLAELAKLAKKLDEDFDSIQGKVEHAPHATSTGILLRTQRDELPAQSEFRKRDAQLSKETARAHLLLMELKDERKRVADPATESAIIIKERSKDFAEYDQQQVAQAVTLLIQTRRDLLDKLIVDQDRLLRDLSELEVVNQDANTQILEFRSYLDERVLWVRSDEMIGPRDVKLATTAALELAKPAHWTHTVQAIAGETVRRPSALAGALALLLLAFTFRQRLDRKLAKLCEPPSPGQPMQFGLSLTGFFISIVLSASWPAILMAIGYKLGTATEAAEFTQALGKSFFAVAVLVWGCQVIREICLDGRVGHRMFGWPPHVLGSVRHTLELTVAVGAPLIGILFLANNVSIAGAPSLHRITLIVTLVFIAIQSYGILRSKGSLMKAISSSNAESMVARLSRPICMLAVGVPVTLAGISAYGYHYSATQLSGRFAESIVAIIGLVILHALSLRWLRLTGYNRRLRNDSFNHSNAASESAIEDSDGSEPPSGLDREAIVAEHELRWQETADAHIRELLRHAVVITLLVGGWFIWSEVLPALLVLDHVALWDNVMKVSEVVTDPLGKTTIQQYETNVPTTLKDIIVAGLIVMATFVIGRRMSSLLEVTVLQRLPIDLGGRHAIAILLRYAATITGLIFACRVIHLSWSSVQWLAAAMTVGLGFGLQEIFANLVSGLIILLERPIRAGDVVTIGDVTGTVTRMQMRATTITDFDRRELIVPNKRFITDNVINWTLSDPICRTIVPVGVAYGTDTQHVETQLLNVARKSSLVLDSPEPCVVFAGFGDSTLNFELRVFIAHRQSQPGVISALNMDINQAFAEADIEISFPQRDLHIRSVNANVVPKFVGTQQIDTTGQLPTNKAAA